MKRAFFPGSFDPVTNGHLSIIARASELFDEVIVGIMTNTQKRSLYTGEQRQTLIKANIQQLSNVSVVTIPIGLTVNVAREYGAQYLIRGIRDEADFTFEKRIAELNYSLDANVETVFLLSQPGEDAISSSMIKEIAQFGGDVTKFVPQNVENALKTTFKDDAK